MQLAMAGFGLDNLSDEGCRMTNETNTTVHKAKQPRVHARTFGCSSTRSSNFVLVTRSGCAKGFEERNKPLL